MAGRGDLNGWWRFGAIVVGVVVRLAFRIRVVDAQHVPTRGAGIVASNHVSVLDGVVLALAIAVERRRMTRFLTAAEFFRKPPFGWALRRYRQIPILRGANDEGALDEAIATIRGGALAGIFPEGTVNPDPDLGLLRGRTGVARVSLAAAAPVIPVAVWGTQRRWPRSGFRWGRPLRPSVAVVFGSTIAADGDPRSLEDTRRLTAGVMEEIGVCAERARAAAR